MKMKLNVIAVVFIVINVNWCHPNNDQISREPSEDGAMMRSNNTLKFTRFICIIGKDVKILQISRVCLVNYPH